ncbi:MAG: hypothetical protein MZV63_50595 [Marinilabiliales bacterium]|nr:hypothetical protein [Marinilabiliales bacterium]
MTPTHPGSLGIAISEAIEIALQDPYTKYSLGSVLNHVISSPDHYRAGSTDTDGEG